MLFVYETFGIKTLYAVVVFFSVALNTKKCVPCRSGQKLAAYVSEYRLLQRPCYPLALMFASFDERCMLCSYKFSFWFPTGEE